MEDASSPLTPTLNAILIRQFDSPIRMLLKAIDLCPDAVWTASDGHPPIWQHVLHAAYYVEKWMRTPNEPFLPPAFADFAAVDLTAPPEPALDRELLRRYLHDLADRSRHLLQTADEAQLIAEVEMNGGVQTLMDRALGQLRHVMYHVGCISTILCQHTGEPLPWISYTHY